FFGQRGLVQAARWRGGDSQVVLVFQPIEQAEHIRDMAAAISMVDVGDKDFHCEPTIPSTPPRRRPRRYLFCLFNKSNLLYLKKLPAAPIVARMKPSLPS